MIRKIGTEVRGNDRLEAKMTGETSKGEAREARGPNKKIICIVPAFSDGFAKCKSVNSMILKVPSAFKRNG